MLNLLKNQNSRFKRVAALIDGEHYPQVTNDAIKKLKKEFNGDFCGIFFLGGTEKITTGSFADFFEDEVFVIKDLYEDFVRALDKFKPDLVFDLSDKPVVNSKKRMEIASLCFFKKASYMGPDFFFEFQEKEYKLKTPSISLIGTGKRIGKTAISTYIAQEYKKLGLEVIVVAMGRGGPPKPQILKGRDLDITPEYLLSLSKQGLHACSDYIEDALMSKITTIGCRRCGGGFGGKAFLSNVVEGSKIADSFKPDIIILEGSGSALPDSESHMNICVVGCNQNWHEIIGYLGIYRIMISDVIIITMCEKPIADKRKIEEFCDNIKKINKKAKIFLSVFRPLPLGDLNGKKVVLGMTAESLINEKIKKFIENKYNCKIVGTTFNLSNRILLKEDLSNFNEFDLILTELKAAAVDVLTSFALENGKEVVYMNNIPYFKSGKKSFRECLIKIYNDIK